MISSINNGLVLLNIADFWQQIIIGCIIIGAMSLDQLAMKTRIPTFAR